VIRDWDNLSQVATNDRIERILDSLAARSTTVGEILKEHHALNTERRERRENDKRHSHNSRLAH
jgi:hypothetical protein